MQDHARRMPGIALFAAIVASLGLTLYAAPAASADTAPAVTVTVAQPTAAAQVTASAPPPAPASTSINSSSATATPQAAIAPGPAPSESLPPEKLPRPLTIAILIGMTLVWVICLTACLRTLGAQNWSLALALSEEVKLPPDAPAPAAGALPPMVASASRLSAMIGIIVLGSFFVALGYYVIWQLCNGQSIEAANGAWTYFLGGLSLFAP